MTKEEKEVVLHCLRSMIDEELCEECPLWGSTGTDHCEEDCVRLAIKELEQEPCEDCISRQAALDQAMDYGSNTYLVPVNSIKALPPVTLQPKMGHWIYTGDYITEGMLKCSECGFEHDVSERFSFCPECGAKMVEPQARSEE